jgi:hypothetical protein
VHVDANYVNAAGGKIERIADIIRGAVWENSAAFSNDPQRNITLRGGRGNLGGGERTGRYLESGGGQQQPKRNGDYGSQHQSALSNSFRIIA